MKIFGDGEWHIASHGTTETSGTTGKPVGITDLLSKEDGINMSQ